MNLFLAFLFVHFFVCFGSQKCLRLIFVSIIFKGVGHAHCAPQNSFFLHEFPRAYSEHFLFWVSSPPFVGFLNAGLLPLDLGLLELEPLDFPWSCCFVGAGFSVWSVIMRRCCCVATGSLGMMSLQPFIVLRCMLQSRPSAPVVRSCVWCLIAVFILLKNKLAKIILKAVLRHFSLFICHVLLSHPISACISHASPGWCHLPSSMITYLNSAAHYGLHQKVFAPLLTVIAEHYQCPRRVITLDKKVVCVSLSLEVDIFLF